MDYVRTIGFVVAGYSLDDTKSGGTAWCWGVPPTGSTDYHWFRSLTDPPTSVGIEVNPVTQDFVGASFTFDLAFDDDEAECLLHQQRIPRYVVGSDRSASATQIRIVDNLTDDNSITTLGNSVIWVGDEAIKLAAYNASLFGSTGGYGCTRGYYSTPAQPHSAGASVFHVAPNRIRHREVLLVLYDHETGSDSVIWRGFVDSLRSSSDGTRLTISTTDLYSALQNVNVNTQDRSLASRIQVARFPAGVRDGFFLPGSLGSSSVFKSGEADPTIALQLDDELFVYIDYDVSEDEFLVGGEFPKSFPVVREDAEPGEVELYENVNELFVIDYATDAGLINDDGTAQSAMTTSGVSATRELEYPFHPAAIILAFVLSSTSSTASQLDYDVLAGEWSFRLDSSVVNITSFEEIIDKYPTFRVERMVLGWDGRSENLWEVIREYCLKPFGLFLGIDDDGRLALAEYASQLGIDDFYLSQDLTPVPELLEYFASRSDTVDTVTGLVGQTPWFDGYRLDVNSGPLDRNSNRSRIFAEERIAEILIPFGPANSLPRRNSRAFARLQQFAASGAFAIPRVAVRVPDPDIDGLSYDIGAFVNISNLDIEDAWLVDRDGNRVRLDGTSNISATGIIIGRQLEVATNTYVLSLLLQGAITQQLIRLRAPSAEVSVDSSGTSTTITVEQNAFHAGADDTSYFTAGDEVIVADAQGAYQTGSAVVTAVTATTITVGTAVETFAGNIIRLSDYYDYANAGVISGAGDNVYFYLSRDGASLGSGSDMHRYG